MPKLIIANWKSNLSLHEATTWVETFAATSTGWVTAQATVVVAPPFTHLSSVGNARETAMKQTSPAAPVAGSAALPFFLAAQDVSAFPFGAYTGAIAAEMLVELGVQYVLVGHSERRLHFHETDRDVAAKVTQILAAGMTPVLCLDTPYIESQAAALAADELSQVIVAYEPLSAIGSGKNQDVGTVQEVKTRIQQVYGESVPVLYGGSVTADNCGEYLLVADGALVGGASLDPQQFAAVVATAQ